MSTTYTLQVKETGNKAAKYHYTVINDQTGEVVSERSSNREYVACTVNGSYYFGRLDLIGKADHGKTIKYAQGWGRDARGKLAPGLQPESPKRLEALTTIAYKK